MKNWYKTAQTEMNLFSNPRGVKSAFLELEGQEMEKSYGWEDWVHYLQLREDLSDLPEILQEMEEGIVASIYGQGGWHRYHIYGDGRVIFSESHAQGSFDEGIEKAKSFGFEIS